jgi:hypothetical protein
VVGWRVGSGHMFSLAHGPRRRQIA